MIMALRVSIFDFQAKSHKTFFQYLSSNFVKF